MRRVLLLVLAATPSLALGGDITATSKTINLAQCRGAQPSPDVLNLGDQMNVNLSWTVTLESGVTSIPTDGSAHYTLYASSQVEQAGQSTTSTSNRCDINNSGTGTAPQKVNLPSSTDTDITITSGTGDAGTITNQSYALKDIVSASSVGCSVTAQTTVYLCAQLFIGGTASGWAITQFTVDPTTPTVAPSAVHATPGDGKLHLNCTGGTNISTFKATASLGGTIVARSNQANSCGDLVIGGLTNNTQYDVVVYGISGVNNPGPGSTPPLSDASTIPIPTNDYWEQYKQDGGPETGGCSTGGIAAGLAGALSLLLVLRRRKS